MAIPRENIHPAHRATAIVFEDPLSLELLARIEHIAPSDAPVLVMGETGTGKELIAREVHARSRRADQPFLAVNAGAFSEHLVESELFGHERGAFTGAVASQAGWFEAADGGTLFLDEIGDLPLGLQVKLLRVLSTGEVTRLGSRVPRRVNVRVIAATNVDLMAALVARRFREDLFYRLSVAQLVLPPLRDRPGDILPLARFFVERYAQRVGKAAPRLGRSAAEALLAQDWRGNIRELENAIHHALLVCRGPELTASDLGLPNDSGLHARPRPLGAGAVVRITPERAAPARAGLSPAAAAAEPSPSALVPLVPRDEGGAWAAFEQSLRGLLHLGLPDLHARVESTLLSAAFRSSGQNQLETARLLGLSRHVVRARLIEHGQLPGPLRRGASARGNEAAEPPRLLPTGSAFSAGAASRAPRELRVGFQKLGLLMLVKSIGALDAAFGSRDVHVAWREYAGGIQIVDALRSGELDVGVVGDCPAVYAQAEQVPVVYVAAEPPAPCGAALLVPAGSQARSVYDLRGKRVAVNRAAQAHYLLMLALEEAGLSREDVDICFQPPERALGAFQAGEVDAWAVWDPWLSAARLDLGARVLRDTSGLFESSVYYLARRELAERHPELVNELCNQLGVAARWVASDPGRAAHLAAPSLGLSARALAASLDRQLCSVAVTPAQLAAQQHIADQCVRLRLIPRPVSVADAQWPRALAG